MSLRQGLPRAWAGIVAVFLGACGGGSSPSPRPSGASGSGLNVLLITIDTLRADHLGIYGYRRNTSPRIDALAREGTVFTHAFTYWPKTRGSFVMMLTGRRPSQNGYSRQHPVVLGFNPTIADSLKRAGYTTAAIVDNPNVAAVNGYSKGFDSYRETWEEEDLVSEMDRARAITEGAVRFLRAATGNHPFLLWLHYVNPHAPYTPPAPYDTAFLDAAANEGPRLKPVRRFHGGIPEHLAVAGKDRLGYYVAQYDGEIAAVDDEVGQVLAGLKASKVGNRTVVILTSDHGESLGDHDYYFDHGEDLFDPCLAIPLIIAVPGSGAGQRSDLLASTLDVFPTILDAAEVSYPADLAGASLLPAVRGAGGPRRERLYAQNEQELSATFGARLKLVATPGRPSGAWYALYDRVVDPGETTDLAAARPEEQRLERRELSLYLERAEREWSRTRTLLGGAPVGEGKMTAEACEKLKALGYVQECNP